MLSVNPLLALTIVVPTAGFPSVSRSRLRGGDDVRAKLAEEGRYVESVEGGHVEGEAAEAEGKRPKIGRFAAATSHSATVPSC